MKRFLIFAALVAMTATAAIAQTPSNPARPRLVVGIVVDQMRWDYLYTCQHMWGDGGFNRLLGEGYSCANTMIDYLPTVTACGHASIYTGSTPAIHGIAGNNYKIDGHNTSSVRDNTVSGVGTTSSGAQKSPRNLMVTTLGDQLKLATGGKGRVVGVSLKDRAAVLPAGHGADGAYWYDKTTTSFITSTYYCNELPKWVVNYNNAAHELLAQDMWDKPYGVTATFGMAEAALRGEQLGKDDITDLLAISVSTTDMTSHHFGARSAETDSIYSQLDRDLARFLSVLDREVGQGNYLLFLSADHGGTYSEPHMRALNLPSGRFYDTQVQADANAALRTQFGVDNLITDAMEYSFYLNHHAIDSAGLDRNAVVDAALKAIGDRPEVMWAVDLERLSDAAVPQEIKERLIKGYHRKRSGEIFVMPVTGYYASWDGDVRGSNHGSWNQSDTHIPLLFFGWHVPHGETTRLTHMTDIAPTVAAMLHIQAPDGALGLPISFE